MNCCTPIGYLKGLGNLTRLLGQPHTCCQPQFSSQWTTYLIDIDRSEIEYSIFELQSIYLTI